MTSVWTSLLDFLGLVALAAGLGLVAAGAVRPGIGLAVAGVVLLAGSALSARLSAPRPSDGEP